MRKMLITICLLVSLLLIQGCKEKQNTQKGNPESSSPTMVDFSNSENGN